MATAAMMRGMHPHIRLLQKANNNYTGAMIVNPGDQRSSPDENCGDSSSWTKLGEQSRQEEENWYTVSFIKEIMAKPLPKHF